MDSDHQARLIQAIEDSTDYWTTPNLAFDYIKQYIVSLLRDALTEVVPEIKQLHEVEAESSDGTAKGVHYTTIGVLMRLLQSPGSANPGIIRLYDSMHLNDPDEGNYLPRRIALEPEFKWLEDQDEFVARDEADGPLNEIAYLASFVAGDKATDNLVYWRTYGREGRGCSIVCSIDSKHMQKVLYGDDVNSAIDLLRPVLSALTPVVAVKDEKVAALLAHTVWSSLRRSCTSTRVMHMTTRTSAGASCQARRWKSRMLPMITTTGRLECHAYDITLNGQNCRSTPCCHLVR